MNAVRATRTLHRPYLIQISWRSRSVVIITRLVVIAAVLAAWELVTRLGLVDKSLVSSPPDVAMTWVKLIKDSQVQSALAQTGIAILVAFVIATATGVVAGFVIGLSPLVRKAYYPSILFMLSMPKVVFVPIFLLVFGLGPQTAAAFGAFQAFFYVTVTVVGGVGLVGERELRLARAFRASRLQTFIHIIVPATSHALFAAIWFGIIQSFTGALIVELFVSAGGVGQLITRYQQAFRTSSVIALALTLAVAAVLCGVLINRLEQRWFRWRIES